ncbi:1-acyl-sn-glycerol-3-phosphate acyltransferase [Candidatus Poribacteria bacterium]|nr:1-acyl-sn-glycerol-3-phosphate acyltransferase [Candidatus Poribacteria bacterium]
MLSFIPPKHSTAGYRLLSAFNGAILRGSRKGLRLNVDADDLERLRAALPHSVVLLPNHCNHDDPYLMFALSSRLRRPFFFLAARESFTELGGGRWRGWVMQQAGSYSVVRGTADRASFRATRALIADGSRPLVIFPEGELSHRPGAVTPFETGVTTLSFWGLEDRITTGKGSDVLLVPTGIRYEIDSAHEEQLRDGLAGLERDLLGSVSREEPLERFRAIGRHLLDVLETTYYGEAESEAPLTERVARLRSGILEQMEHFFGMEPRSSATILDRARALRNRLDDEVYAELGTPSRYAHDLRERRSRTFATFTDAIKRVCAFHAFDALAVERSMRTETFFETLWLIEEEVYGSPKSLVPRTGRVRVGEPIRLDAYRDAYAADKRAAIRDVTMALENAVERLIAEP